MERRAGGTGALAGVRVLDLTRILAGPQCTMMLGDLGADVIKVELPDLGDDTRNWDTAANVPGFGVYFVMSNRNKRSVEVDLKTPLGRERIRQLVAHSDVMVENFRPGVLDRLGLPDDELTGINPRLIRCSITGFGVGAGASLPGYDYLAQAAGGLMSVTGYPDGDPTRVGAPVSDVITGMHATIGVLAALHRRTTTGRGQRIEVNLLSSTLAGLANQASNYLLTREIPGRVGNLHPNITPYETFDTAGQPIVVAVANERQFSSLLEVLGCAEVGSNKAFATNEARLQHREELRELLQERFSTDSGEAWAARLQERGIPCSPINDVAEAIDLAANLDLHPVVEMETSAGATLPMIASPLTLSDDPPTYRLPPPALGEHTDEVLAWLDENVPVGKDM
ncbi:MAG: CoA transferase [Chloroflexota bacterium]